MAEIGIVSSPRAARHTRGGIWRENTVSEKKLPHTFKGGNEKMLTGVSIPRNA